MDAAFGFALVTPTARTGAFTGAYTCGARRTAHRRKAFGDKRVTGQVMRRDVALQVTAVPMG